jgi:hypothetical protein
VRETLFLLLTLALCPAVFSQGWYPMGARSASMSNAVVALEDVWSFHHNPAGLASLKSISAGVSYENRFLLRELQSQGVAVAVPLKKGVISVGGQFYGYQQFRSRKAGLGYSMLLSERFAAGVQVNYASVILNENYGSRHSATAEVGILAKITDQWKIGMSAFNLGRTGLSDFEDDRFSTIMRLGTSYELDKVILLAEAEKDLDHPVRLKTGLEYEPLESFFFRAGFATRPIEFSFGFGYRYRFLQLDLGSAYHQQLGWSPHFSLTFQFKDKE